MELMGDIETFFVHAVLFCSNLTITIGKFFLPASSKVDITISNKLKICKISLMKSTITAMLRV
jgi:hypothetical protein